VGFREAGLHPIQGPLDEKAGKHNLSNPEVAVGSPPWVASEAAPVSRTMSNKKCLWKIFEIDKCK